jgi:hypothetical protein
VAELAFATCYHHSPLLFGAGQFDGEYCFNIRGTDDANVSLMSIDNSQGDRETETHTAGRRFAGVVDWHMLATVETVEDMGEIIRMDAFAVVNDL